VTSVAKAIPLILAIETYGSNTIQCEREVQSALSVSHRRNYS